MRFSLHWILLIRMASLRIIMSLITPMTQIPTRTSYRTETRGIPATTRTTRRTRLTVMRRPRRAVDATRRAKRASIVATAPHLPLFSCTSWSAPSKSPTTRTCIVARSSPSRLTCPRSASKSGFRIDGPSGVAKRKPSKPRYEWIPTFL